MTLSHSRLTAPLRHIARNAVAYLALFVALGGTSFAAGSKLWTGADIQDDSLTGADILESSLAKVPSATNADQLGGMVASSFLKGGSAAGGDLAGTYPNPDIAPDAVTSAEIANQSVGLFDLANGAVSAPKLISGAAATNVWGKGRWAPPNATQRGYVHIRRNNVGSVYEAGGFESISYPVPLEDGDILQSHVIMDGDAPPEGCGGTMAEPTAAPGHLCIFYDPAYDGDTVSDVTFSSTPEARYGRNLRVNYGNHVCDCAIADVVWALTPPI
jgi:hypothetical protein